MGIHTTSLNTAILSTRHFLKTGKQMVQNDVFQWRLKVKVATLVWKLRGPITTSDWTDGTLQTKAESWTNAKIRHLMTMVHLFSCNYLRKKRFSDLLWGQMHNSLGAKVNVICLVWKRQNPQRFSNSPTCPSLRLLFLQPPIYHVFVSKGDFTYSPYPGERLVIKIPSPLIN